MVKPLPSDHDDNLGIDVDRGAGKYSNLVAKVAEDCEGRRVG